MFMTALMNTSGGLGVLYCNRAESDKKRDLWLMNLKDHVTSKWVPNSTYRSLIRYKYTKIGNQLRIYLFVCKSSHMITFKYNVYGRHATGIESVTDREEVQRILDASQRTSLTLCSSQLQKVLGTRESFGMNEEIPTEYCESQNIEFKHYYDNETETKELTFVASKLKSRLDRDNELLTNISAFANTDGGSLILGVKESMKHPVVRGFETTHNQDQEERELTGYIAVSLNGCIWAGNGDNQSAVRGTDWDLFYHDVYQPDGNMKKVIEITVTRHSGGMFLKPPTYVFVNDSGDLTHFATFQEWNEKFCASSVSPTKESKCNQLQAHMKASVELKDPTVTREHSNRRLSGTVKKDDFPTTQAAQREDVKLQKSFEGDDIEITVHDLNLLDCCTGRMAKYLDAHQGQRVWYPCVQPPQMKTWNGIQYQNIIEHISKKEWHGIATVIPTESEPGNDSYDSEVKVCMGCYVLIVSTNAHPKLICCFDVELSEDTMQSEKQDSNHLVRYALHHARILKKKFLALAINRPYQSVPFHFEVQVLLVHMTGAVTEIWDSEGQHSQPVPYPCAKCGAEFALSCNGLAHELLKDRYSVKDRHGKVLIEHLTEEQARLLMDRKERILVVNGRSGTGKTVIALNLVHDAKSRGYTANEILYICSSDGLKAFVTSQTDCEVWTLKATTSLSQQQRQWLTKTAKTIIVDDIHAISLSEDWKENPDDLYNLLFTHAAQSKAEVAIFFDPDQDFHSCLPESFHLALRDLAEHIATESNGLMATQDIKLHTMHENIRNSRKINRFMQASQKQAKVEGTCVCLNETEGDNVIFDFIGNSLEDNASYLDAKLRGLVQEYMKAISLSFVMMSNRSPL